MTGGVVEDDWPSIWRRRFDELYGAADLADRLRLLVDAATRLAARGPSVEISNGSAPDLGPSPPEHMSELRVLFQELLASFSWSPGAVREGSDFFSPDELDGLILELKRRFGEQSLSELRLAALQHVATSIGRLPDPNHELRSVRKLASEIERYVTQPGDGHLSPTRVGGAAPHEAVLPGGLIHTELRAPDSKYARVSWNSEGAVLLIASVPGAVTWTTHRSVSDALGLLLAEWSEFSSIEDLIRQQVVMGALSGPQAQLLRSAVRSMIDGQQ